MTNSIITNVEFEGDGKAIYPFVNLYGCKIGKNVKIGPFVEIQKNSSVGENSVISSHSFVCEGVTIEKDVFVGHGVMFCNDKNPKANNKNWKLEKIVVKNGASVGSNSTILPGVIIGENSLVGAGSVVTKNIPDNEVWTGNPARFIRKN